MKLIYLEQVNSTQTYAKEQLKCNKNVTNVCFYTYMQTMGLGSKNNKWEGENGNLFFTFIISQNDLPSDLPHQSISIYFAYILKECLFSLGSNVFLKWPNDLYIKNNKIAGLITNKYNDKIICGIGLNINKTKTFHGSLDININKEELLKYYFNQLEYYPSWKQIFSKYKLEFHVNKKYFTNINNEKVSLENAILNEDGSLNINNKKVYSLR